jgi:hypothetical protein
MIKEYISFVSCKNLKVGFRALCCLEESVEKSRGRMVDRYFCTGMDSGRSLSTKFSTLFVKVGRFGVW